MKALVLYRSKSGFTKKYAEWIARELSAEVLEAKGAGPALFADYDTVIYGGGLYAAGINGVKLITGNLDKLAGKKVIVFATGASPEREDVTADIVNKNFTGEQREKITFFYLRGGFDRSRLKGIDRFLMGFLINSIKKKKERTPDEAGMLGAFEHPVDFTAEKKIASLVAFARE